MKAFLQNKFHSLSFVNEDARNHISIYCSTEICDIFPNSKFCVSNIPQKLEFCQNFTKIKKFTFKSQILALSEIDADFCNQIDTKNIWKFNFDEVFTVEKISEKDFLIDNFGVETAYSLDQKNKSFMNNFYNEIINKCEQKFHGN